MPRKCSVFACKTNYRSQQDKTMCGKTNKIPIYCFPKKRREREQWIKSVPNANLNVTNNTVIYQQHGPSNFDTIEVHGKICPKNPPSVWPDVPSNQIPTPSAVQRNIKKLQY